MKKVEFVFAATRDSAEVRFRAGWGRLTPAAHATAPDILRPISSDRLWKLTTTAVKSKERWEVDNSAKEYSAEDTRWEGWTAVQPDGTQHYDNNVRSLADFYNRFGASKAHRIVRVIKAQTYMKSVITEVK